MFEVISPQTERWEWYKFTQKCEIFCSIMNMKINVIIVLEYDLRYSVQCNSIYPWQFHFDNFQSNNKNLWSHMYKYYTFCVNFFHCLQYCIAKVISRIMQLIYICTIMMIFINFLFLYFHTRTNFFSKTIIFLTNRL